MKVAPKLNSSLWKRTKNILKGIIIGVLASSIGLMGGELLLRDVFSHKLIPLTWKWTFSEERVFIPDENLIYKPNPRYAPPAFEFFDEKFLHNVWEKAQARIVTIGDSFTFGHGVGKDESYPSVLEELLKTRSTGAEVINAGIPGYGLDQEYHFFRTFLSEYLNPTLVIWAINENDFGNAWDFPLYTIENESLKFIGGKRHWVYLQGKVYERIPKIFRDSHLVNATLSSIRTLYSSPISPKIEKNKWILSKIFLEIEEMNKLSKDQDFVLLLALMPHQKFIEEGTSAGDFFEAVIRKANESGISYLNVNTSIIRPTDTIQRNEGLVLGAATDMATQLFLHEPEFAYGWRHPNQVGHKLIAEAIAQTLFLSEDLIGQKP